MTWVIPPGLHGRNAPENAAEVWLHGSESATTRRASDMTRNRGCVTQRRAKVKFYPAQLNQFVTMLNLVFTLAEKIALDREQSQVDCHAWKSTFLDSYRREPQHSEVE